MIHREYFFLRLNVNFWNYYFNLHTYAREPPLNHLDSTSSDQLSLVYLLTIDIYKILWAGQHIKGKGAQSPRVCYALQPTHPREISPHPISQLSTAKVSSTLRHAIPRCYVLLEECPPCVSQNTFSVHSPCSSFTISATRTIYPTPLRSWR